MLNVCGSNIISDSILFIALHDYTHSVMTQCGNSHKMAKVGKSLDGIDRKVNKRPYITPRQCKSILSVRHTFVGMSLPFLQKLTKNSTKPRKNKYGLPILFGLENLLKFISSELIFGDVVHTPATPLLQGTHLPFISSL